MKLLKVYKMKVFHSSGAKGSSILGYYTVLAGKHRFLNL
jgi:hypothetical protein